MALVLLKLDIECKVVQNINHAWNLVEIDSKYYIVDFTHNITQNENRCPEALKATKYTDAFTLVNAQVSSDVYKDFSFVYSPISESSYSREEIATVKQHLTEKGVCFEYDSNPPYISCIISDE